MSKKMSVSVDYDQNPINPRLENENLGTMICFHSRYILGDKHNFRDKDEFIFNRLETYMNNTEDAEAKYNEIAKSIDRDIYSKDGDFRKAVDEAVLDFIKTDLIRPLFLYDHSMQSISTGSFDGKVPHARWDSGQVGWIYVAAEDVKNEFGDLSEESWEKANETLNGEVNEYNHYIQGDCYEYTVKEDGEVVDSCSGFSGNFNDVIKEMSESVSDKHKHLFERVEECGIEYEEATSVELDPIGPTQFGKDDELEM